MEIQPGDADCADHRSRIITVYSINFTGPACYLAVAEVYKLSILKNLSRNFGDYDKKNSFRKNSIIVFALALVGAIDSFNFFASEIVRSQEQEIQQRNEIFQKLKK